MADIAQAHITNGQMRSFVSCQRRWQRREAGLERDLVISHVAKRDDLVPPHLLSKGGRAVGGRRDDYVAEQRCVARVARP